MGKCNLPVIGTHMKGKQKEHQCNTPLCNVHSPHVRVGMKVTCCLFATCRLRDLNTNLKGTKACFFSSLRFLRMMCGKYLVVICEKDFMSL